MVESGFGLGLTTVTTFPATVHVSHEAKETFGLEIRSGGAAVNCELGHGV